MAKIVGDYSPAVQANAAKDSGMKSLVPSGALLRVISRQASTQMPALQCDSV